MSAGPAVFASPTVWRLLFSCASGAGERHEGLGPLGALGVFCAALRCCTRCPLLVSAAARPGRSCRTRRSTARQNRRWAVRASRHSRSPARADRGRVAPLRSCGVRCASSPGVGHHRSCRCWTARCSALRAAARQARARGGRDAGFWKRVGDRVAMNPKRTFSGAIAVLLRDVPGLPFFSTDLTTNDGTARRSSRSRARSCWPRASRPGSGAPTDIIVERAEDVEKVSAAVAGVDGVQGSPPVAAERTAGP